MNVPQVTLFWRRAWKNVSKTFLELVLSILAGCVKLKSSIADKVAFLKNHGADLAVGLDIEIYYAAVLT